MITRLFAWWFKQKGWKVEGTIPPEISKCVVIAAPHTSNWDFVYALATYRILNLPINYLAKKELFKFPLKGILKSTGAIPVIRSISQNLVETIVDKFNEAEHLYLMIPAEGTRKKVEKWKSGFYHAAIGANVPILMGYLDYKNKKSGFGKVLYPSGDTVKDLAMIKDFYSGITGKNHELFNIEAIRF
jgi:1-acyl-sn-glycerol-3-phosphate acyltransferase